MCSFFSRNQFNSNAYANQLNDDVLVAATRVGSEPVFSERWSRHCERTCGVIAQIIRIRENLQDILQRTYIRLLLHLVSFNGEAQLSTWLGQIAINSAFYLFTKRRSRPEHFTDSCEPDWLTVDLPDHSERVEAPKLRENAHINDLASSSPRSSAIGALPRKSSAMLSYRTPRPRGKKNPPNPIPTPPIAGHHIQ
jgi:DNA-directed RNA polymerase specialized sigma24 family protein